MPKAQKKYQCALCKEVIEKGERYRNEFLNPWDDKRTKMCVGCYHDANFYPMDCWEDRGYE